nr:recombinase family protein [Arthrobacter silviterrae]
MADAGITAEHIHVDRKSGATTDRPGLTAALAQVRTGDVLVVHTLNGPVLLNVS